MLRRMYRRLAILALPVALLAAHQQSLHAQTATDPEPASIEKPAEMTASQSLPGLESFVDGLAQATLIEFKGLPGITVSVVKDGEILLAKGYGFADIEKNIPVNAEETLFRIGSITKTFTGLAVMQLVEQGKLDLDVDVNTYLDSFSIPATFDKPITLGALISHRAGFEDAGYGHIFVQDPADVLSIEEYLANYMPKRVREPGKTATYTNYGITLAGYIVEAVSGQDFATYVDEHIFQPLKMSHSTVRDPLGADYSQSIRPELMPLLATGYAKGPSGKPVALPPDLIGRVAPAGSIYSTSPDMARYMMARIDDDQYDGGRLVGIETTKQMHQRIYNDRPLMTDMAHAMADGYQDGYKLRWHNGGTTTFAAEMVLYPELKLGIFVALNSSDGGAQATLSIPRLIFQRYFPSKSVLETPVPPEDFAERGQKYAGSYMRTRRSYSQVEKLLALGSVSDITVDSEGYLSLSEGGQVTKLVEIGPGVFQAVEGDSLDRGRTHHVYFYEDENGVPVRAARVANDIVRISYWQSPSFLYLALGVAVLLSLTTILGAWRRFGQGAERTREDRWASRLAFTAALAVLVVAVGLALVAAGAASDPFDLLFHWPPSALILILYMALAIILITAGMLFLIRAVWTDASWKLWRRLHYSLFTASLVMLLVAFYEWNLIGFNYF